MVKIGIVIPTRGLIFTRVLEALEKERKDYDITIYYSHDLPIPQGHNGLCEKALRDGNEYVFFLEEDVVIPARTIEKMLAVQADIVCTDYGVSGWSCITKNKAGEILWCGLGCTLIHRRVLEALEKPYFRADMVLDLPDLKWRKLPEEYIKTRNYGSLDIWFFCKAREQGFKIVQVDGECEHLKLTELGKKETNYGIHQIDRKPEIKNRQVI